MSVNCYRNARIIQHALFCIRLHCFTVCDLMLVIKLIILLCINQHFAIKALTTKKSICKQLTEAVIVLFGGHIVDS